MLLPAPFGPMMLVIAPGSRRSDRSLTARTPPKLTERSLDRKTASGAAAREDRRDIALACAAPVLCRARERSGSIRPTKPSGASRSTTSSSSPTNSRRYCASNDSSSGSSTTTSAPTSGPEHAVGAADHHDQQEQDRLEERKRLRADEVAHRGEHAAGEARRRRREREGRRCGSASDRGRSTGSRSPSRAPPAWPCPTGSRSAGRRAEGDAAVRPSTRNAISRSAKSAAERGSARECRKAVPAAGRAAPLGGALLDHEAERDRDHGEIGPAHAQRRDGEQDARDAGDERQQAASASQKPKPVLVVRMPTT